MVRIYALLQCIQVCGIFYFLIIYLFCYLFIYLFSLFMHYCSVFRYVGFFVTIFYLFTYLRYFILLHEKRNFLNNILLSRKMFQNLCLAHKFSLLFIMAFESCLLLAIFVNGVNEIRARNSNFVGDSVNHCLAPM